MASRNELTLNKVDFSIYNAGLEVQLLSTEMPQAAQEELIAIQAEYPIDVIQVEDTVSTYNTRPTVAQKMVPSFMLQAAKARKGLGLSEHEPLPDEHNPMYHPGFYPTLLKWHQLAKGTGMAIFALDNPQVSGTLSAGRIQIRDFFEECLEYNGEKISAFEYIQLKAMENDMSAEAANEKAHAVKNEHIDFITTEIDPYSWYILSASEDAIGVRARKSLAGQVALRAMVGHDKNTPVRMASLGAGSALPVVESIKQLSNAGYTVESAHLFDMDPMALAVANAVMKSEGIDADVIRLHPQQISFSGESLADIEPESMHYVEAWGLAEYFKDFRAANLGYTALQLLVPGGTYAYGNMLTNRGQKDLFDLVNWQPSVRMRGPAECVRILEDASYTDIHILVPSLNQVYVGYSGKRPSTPVNPPVRRATLRRVK